MKILLIDDDSTLIKSVELALAKESMVLDCAVSAEEGENFAQVYKYSLIILDVLLEDANGIELLKKLRGMKIEVPIIILSGVNDPDKKVEALKNGADDYLTKPFNVEELVARIKAVIRRSQGHSENAISIGDMVIDFDKHITKIGDITVNLTSKEQELLEFMALKKNSAINKESFLEHLYNGLDEPDLRVIDVFICKMRKKLNLISGGKNYIDTIWGRGYILQDPEENASENTSANPLNSTNQKTDQATLEPQESEA